MMRNHPIDNINASSYKAHRHSTKRRKCNLCEQKFTPKSKFQRFCPRCKEENEAYTFADYFEEMRIIN